MSYRLQNDISKKIHKFSTENEFKLNTVKFDDIFYCMKGNKIHTFIYFKHKLWKSYSLF